MSGVPGTIFFMESMPPSVNNMFWNKPGKGRVKSDTYRTWRSAAGWDIQRARPQKIKGHFRLSLTFAEAKRRSNSDLDNRAKACLDLLVEHQIVEDDSLADSISLAWGDLPPTMAVRVEIEGVGE